MTKDEVLQKANEYCGEKGYNEETLTTEFKDKFADFFSKKHQDADIGDEDVVKDLEFNLNTAFSAASKGITSKQKAYDELVEQHKRELEELKKKGDGSTKKTKEEPKIPKELQEKLDRLEQFEIDAKRKEKSAEVLALAKKNVRTDLHKSLENYANDFAVTLDEESEEQAKKLTERFQAIFKDSIGSVKPLAPKSSNTKRDEDILAEIPKVGV